jgi:hypothetical protein
VGIAASGVSDEGVEGVGSHGFGEVEALAGVAAELGEVVMLLGGFDAFADDGQTKAVSELDDGGHDRAAGWVVADVPPWIRLG